MILNFKYTYNVPLLNAQSLIDVSQLLLISSVVQGEFLLDCLTEYSNALGYQSFDNVERTLEDGHSASRFMNSLRNIERHTYLPRSVRLLEACDLDAGVVLVGLMRKHSSKPVRRRFAALPFSRQHQQITSRYEVEAWRDALQV
jgi:hypothetical protein